MAEPRRVEWFPVRGFFPSQRAALEFMARRSADLPPEALAVCLPTVSRIKAGEVPGLGAAWAVCYPVSIVY